MEDGTITNGYGGIVASPNREISSRHKRNQSGGVLSKLSFVHTSAKDDQPQTNEHSGPESIPGYELTSVRKTGRAMAVQRQKTRERRGSLRKVAMLGRGAQRERKEMETSPLNMDIPADIYDPNGPASPTGCFMPLHGQDVGLRSSIEAYASRSDHNMSPPYLNHSPSPVDALMRSQTTSTSPAPTYASTTDDEDILSISKHLSSLHNDTVLSSSPESYFTHGNGGNTVARRRSTHKQASPLSLGLSPNPLPAQDGDWNYSETEWWGWVVLIVTWIVFVTGMGSCLGVWSWAWDVGETPYAPPELEDDPTLPIVGYYPALIILTAVMAWVWVVVAWVGMKYFRHAKITGD